MREKRIRNSPLIIYMKVDSYLGIYKSVLRSLGSPKDINFWWSESEGAFLISADNQPCDGRFAVPNSVYESNSGYTTHSKGLLNAMKDFTGWESGSKIKISGKYDPAIDMVVFKRADAVKEVVVNA